MGRINSYPNVTRPDKADELIIDGAAGTRNVNMANAGLEMVGMISAYQHRSVWRGKNLGSTFTDAQKTAISDGTFDDLYIGDYWVIDGVTYQIVDMDYWFGKGDTSCVKHHVVLMPTKQLYAHAMNNNGTTQGGYMQSEMHLEGLDQAKSWINSAFGSANVLNHREYFSNAVTDGHVSASAWCDSTVDLPNEIMMYGCYVRTAMNPGGSVACTRTIDNTQLAAMRLNPNAINPHRGNNWLRDIVSDSSFAIVYNDGRAHNATSSGTGGVRPVFGLTGGN